MYIYYFKYLECDLAYNYYEVEQQVNRFYN